MQFILYYLLLDNVQHAVCSLLCRTVYPIQCAICTVFVQFTWLPIVIRIPGARGPITQFFLSYYID